MRKNITLKIGIGALAGLLLTTSCTKDFIEKNTNPNENNFASPESLFAPALLSIVNNNLNRGFRINGELAQVSVTNSDSREIHRYEIRNSESNSSWQNWYVQLTNIRNVYTSAEETKQEGYETWQGMSLIIDAYVGSLLTDVYGDVPYSEANQGREGEVSPKFDRQQDVYKQLFEKLEKANELLKLNKVIPARAFNDDPIYPFSYSNGGTRTSAEHWRRFGNSLYLRLLLRTSGKSELGSVAKIKEIVETNSANYPIFENNNDNANFNFTNVVPFVTEFYNYRDLDFNGDKGYSEFFINTLLDLKDSRITKWATEATLGVYSGIQSGYKQGNVPELGSRMLLSLKTERLLGNIMNYSELQFILAEAAAKGYITGNVTDFYNRGIAASFQSWKAPLTADYFAQPIVKLAATDNLDTKMEKIHTQRYFAMLFTDFQQWTEIRRTGYPKLFVGPGVGNDGIYPTRLPFPASTISYNRTNYLEAVANMGGADDSKTKVWWNN
ncbi:SusD/RagB family nutrient-binding outer membrane lipoprotein [Sphingobacterium psychroaquaticum]|uniref:Starch-binding associating with outer membrane n=1 Tax=Sphingobacterium psychroaquaticum TaxID=561061 RepID=A0A1X7I3C2_9SPHI|nr:SusD/RagB family nutrient-binding outer membrane lipoprotein [Sphingobacterium psychroaquaticum]SMG08654.1 Starch-binding associating with outer membrane [Sphingobacterium psychroaquaticum]